MRRTYAEFKNHKFARDARRRLRARIGERGRVQIIDKISHHTMPLQLTAARVGALLGALILGVMATASVALVSMFDFPMLASVETLLLTMGLATLLGALAGALAFASDNGEFAMHLRRWLRSGKPVVVVDDLERGHEQTLRACGAVRVHSVSV